MADTISKQKRSEVMRKIKSTNTKMEVLFNKQLSKLGYKYKKNVADLIGKPDIVFAKKKLVIFLDSCFWHGCKIHCRMPQQNRPYWVKKIQRNRLRDRQVNFIYKTMGWKVFRIWEHEIKKTPDKALLKIQEVWG